MAELRLLESLADPNCTSRMSDEESRLSDRLCARGLAVESGNPQIDDAGDRFVKIDITPLGREMLPVFREAIAMSRE